MHVAMLFLVPFVFLRPIVNLNYDIKYLKLAVMGRKLKLEDNVDDIFVEYFFV